MCRLMHATSIDATNNYRCPFEGPGDTGSPTENNYYDIGGDLLVQRFESGCAYTSDCNTADGECIGIDGPDGTVTAPNNAIYYSRRTGQCYINTSAVPGGDAWSPLNARCDFHPPPVITGPVWEPLRRPDTVPLQRFVSRSKCQPMLLPCRGNHLDILHVPIRQKCLWCHSRRLHRYRQSIRSNLGLYGCPLL